MMDHEQWLEQHERAIAEHKQRIAEQERLGALTDRRLDRAIRLSVLEARNERKKRQEMDARFDEKITQLAAAQLLTEEALRGLIKSLEQGGNGKQR